MHFHWKNPAHLFAGFMLFISFFVFLILPLLSLVMPVADMDTINQFDDLNLVQQVLDGKKGTKIENGNNSSKLILYQPIQTGSHYWGVVYVNPDILK